MRFRRIKAGQLPIATVELARELIGCVLVREIAGELIAGRIIETEAYGPGDPASHAYVGPRPRNASMFLGPFHAYVYQIYGSYFCVNVSSEVQGEGAGVLLRALEPLAGIEAMRRLRKTETLRELCRGPGRLAQALDIDRALDGVNLVRDGRLWLAARPAKPGAIGVSRRIGISRAASLEMRFYESGNAMVSGPRALSPGAAS